LYYYFYAIDTQQACRSAQFSIAYSNWTRLALYSQRPLQWFEDNVCRQANQSEGAHAEDP
jgi:hypothetical protein